MCIRTDQVGMSDSKKSGTYLRRPTKVAILNQDFKIEWLSSGDAQGSVDFNDCVIQVVKKYPKDTVVDTLFHELIHAVNYVMGITDSSSEEDATRSLATGLCTVWRHNPKLFAWIHRQITK